MMKYYLSLACLIGSVCVLCIQCRQVQWTTEPKPDVDVGREEPVPDFTFPECSGSDCCSESQKCERVCQTIFYASKQAQDRCAILPQRTVFDIEDLTKGLRYPILQDLRRIDVRTNFRLLLALDYMVVVDIVKMYRIDQAIELLLWFAEEEEVAKELMRISKDGRNQIMYELLATAGDRNLPGLVENGLARKISFEETFFQLLVRYWNNHMLQITHNMIRDEMCGHTFGEGTKVGLCVLRIYCRERRGSDNQYVHSEDLRTNISLRLEDPQLFDYLRSEVYQSNLDRFNLSRPLINDMSCQIICNDTYRGCEGWSI